VDFSVSNSWQDPADEEAVVRWVTGLSRLKARYNPDNLFRVNQNVLPG
jgi:hypothetical protein